ncbi:MAG TPA: SDR family NAD(P)-dependent oxidoreductase, partial [Acidimicrobiia bacterium]|nr:SDR family NAD(P)-dependent oxidoreductase [Acidimicrobiia bacterium]
MQSRPVDQRFSGRTVLVTGATGIGAATAERVAAEGGSVFVVSLDEEPIDSLRESSDRIDG